MSEKPMNDFDAAAKGKCECGCNYPDHFGQKPEAPVPATECACRNCGSVDYDADDRCAECGIAKPTNYAALAAPCCCAELREELKSARNRQESSSQQLADELCDRQRMVAALATTNERAERYAEGWAEARRISEARESEISKWPSTVMKADLATARQDLADAVEALRKSIPSCRGENCWCPAEAGFYLQHPHNAQCKVNRAIVARHAQGGKV